MRPVRLALLAALALPLLAACAQKQSYNDPQYTLQRNLRNRNENFDDRQNRQSLRRQARDDRYDAWFNSVMQ